MASLLSVKNLSVSYGPAQAIFDVSLTADAGEVVAILGANGAGKSTLARRFEESGWFRRYSVDDHIEQELRLPNIEASAQWLSYPGTSNYTEHAPIYLALEDCFTLEAATMTHHENTIIDTTGSVVHLPPTTGALLHERSFVVHLRASEERIANAIEHYFKIPKPVVWSEYFTQSTGQDITSALRESYPALLRARLAMYDQLAHVSIDASRMFGLHPEEVIALLDQERTLTHV